ncbi:MULTISPECIES: hypothetical protein [unclassified Streptomyces]|uniref:hypothetical protein n=1 Tax=unclassified Streptomyces TaxID=2593676 RepID=UPI0032458B71|nr:hypothetical protein OG513_00985 [Streptomyces sp. NBC_00998]
MHKNLRHGLIATACIAAALALTACGSDSGSDKAAASKDPKPAAMPSSPPAASSSGAGVDAKGGSVEGGWISMANPSKPVVLTVKGKTAVVVEGASGLTCQGTTDGKSFDLKCPAGALHAKGQVASVGASELKVTWQEVGTETYQKSEPGKLPTGLPTAIPKP